MSFKHEDRQRVISAIWERAGKKQPGWRVRLDPYFTREAPPSPEALAEREQRLRTPDTRDMTGQILGDPPPGRSALDKKREEEGKPKPRPWWQIGDEDGG